MTDDTCQPSISPCLCQPHYQRSNQVRFGKTVRGSERGTAFAEGESGGPGGVPEFGACGHKVVLRGFSGCVPPPFPLGAGLAGARPTLGWYANNMATPRDSTACIGREKRLAGKVMSVTQSYAASQDAFLPTTHVYTPPRIPVIDPGESDLSSTQCRP